MNKKAVGLTMEYIIIAALLLGALIVLWLVFSNLFGKEAKHVAENIGALEDMDGDEVINMFDRCPCSSGTDEFKGCNEEKETIGPFKEGENQYKKNVKGCSPEIAEAYKIS